MAKSWINADNLSLEQCVLVMGRRRWLILLIVLLTLFTALIITALTPPWYGATATIRVEKPQEKVTLFQAQAQSYYDPAFVEEQQRILTSKKVLYTVIENLDLQEELGAIYNNGAPLPRNIAYSVLKEEMLDVDPQRGTSLVEVTAWAQRDPELAAAIANNVVRVYAEDRIAFAVSSQREGIAKLRSELQEQARRVDERRDEVERLRRELGVAGVDLNVDALAQEIENLRLLERTLINMRVEAIGRKTRWENFSQIEPEEQRNLVNSEMVADPNLQNLLQAYMVAQQQHAQLENQLGEAHPDLAASRKNLETMQAQLDRLLRGYEKALEIAYLEADSRVQELEKQLGRARIEQIASAQEKMRPFEEAVEQLREEEQIYQTIKLTLRQREIDFQAPKKSIEVLSPAEAPLRPGRPNWMLNLALALIGGGLLGVGLAFVVEFLDTSFQSVEALEAGLKLPVLGVVARSAQILGADNAESPAAEPFRVIETNLELARGGGEKEQVLTIQSAGPGEGKSTILYNLAAAAAHNDLRVLIIDSDVRKPTQHQLAGMERAPGLGNVLNGQKELDEAIRPTGVPGLDILTAGEGAASLTLTRGKQLRGYLDSLRTRYDRIFLDSPPLLGVSDAAILASLANGVVLVVQYRRNPQAMSERAKESVESVGGRVLGLVLNHVPESGGGDFQYYTDNYAYYSGSDNGRRRKSPRVGKGSPQTEERLELRDK